MPKFRVGDRVRVIIGDYSTREGIVTRDNINSDWYIVELARDEVINFQEQQLKLVENVED